MVIWEASAAKEAKVIIETVAGIIKIINTMFIGNNSSLLAFSCLGIE